MATAGIIASKGRVDMIETLKRWMEKVKSSPILKPFLAVKNWFQENVIKRKLVIFSVLFVAWISLLAGALYSPERQIYTDDQLKTKQILHFTLSRLLV